MKPLSSASREIVEQLYRTGSLLNRLLAGNEYKKEAIRQIVKASEPAAIPFLLPVISGGDHELRRLAASGLSELSAALTSSELVQLDLEIRESSPYVPTSLGSQPGWYDLKPHELSKLKGLPGYSTVMGFVSSHPSGYVREAAVQELADIHDGSELPFLLIRLNDWVVSVRDAANVALKHRLRPFYATAFASNLDLVQRLLDWKRADHASFVQSVFKLLQDTDGGKIIIDGLKSTNRSVKRISYRLAWGLAATDVKELLTQALNDNDLVIARLAMRGIRSRLNKNELAECLPMALASHFMAVRREALDIYCQAIPEEAHRRLQSALLDRHSSIRQFVRYSLAQKESMDFAGFYRRAIKDPKQPSTLFAALGGLGETGTQADGSAIEPFVTHALSSIRKMALRSLAKLCVEKHLDLFTRMLGDSSPGVSRIAKNALLSRIVLVQPDKVWDVLLSAEADYIRRHALAVLAGLRKWDSLGFILRAASLTKDSLASEVRRHLEWWVQNYNRSFSQPTKAQLQEIHESMSVAKQWLSDRHATAIASILASMPS